MTLFDRIIDKSSTKLVNRKKHVMIHAFISPSSMTLTPMRRKYPQLAEIIIIASLIAFSPVTYALPDDCLKLTAPATFLETSGLVCLQKVIISSEASSQFYKGSLQWLGIGNPNRFKLMSIEFDQTSEVHSPIYSEINEILTLPKVDIPKLFGTERYAVNLRMVPDIEGSGDVLFELAQVEIFNNPDYVAGKDWKPYGMLQPGERKIVDILGHSLPYAMIADASYDFKNVTVESWELIDSMQRSSGMDAGVYKNRDTQELVIAFRGTETCDFSCSLDEVQNSTRDMIADAAIGTGIVSDQFKHAFNFAQDIVKRYPISKITVTGHSLGGGLAQAVGATLGLETYAFNSSPVPDHFFDTYQITLTSEQLAELIHVVADVHDPVSNTNETGDFYFDSHHVTPLIQLNFDRREIIPVRAVNLDDLRFDRHGITRFYDNALALINIYRAGW